MNHTIATFYQILSKLFIHLNLFMFYYILIIMMALMIKIEIGSATMQAPNEDRFAYKLTMARFTKITKLKNSPFKYCPRRLYCFIIAIVIIRSIIAMRFLFFIFYFLFCNFCWKFADDE